MWRAWMIVKYNERSLKYFKALFAVIFNLKSLSEKKRSIIYWAIGRDLLRDIRSAVCIECLVKIARTLFKLDALIFAGQKRQLAIITYKDKALT